jgi:hypothetical protein
LPGLCAKNGSWSLKERMNEMHELNSQELLSQFLKVQIQFISSEQYEPLNTQPTNGTNPEHKFFVNGM